mmetsp:Transcript_84586/g.196678  ORF Transcript_84586/g.196678 Transcript_84586/m.196678 type:complete len:200 (+) Transcript_84586:125-724(+)
MRCSASPPRPRGRAALPQQWHRPPLVLFPQAAALRRAGPLQQELAVRPPLLRPRPRAGSMWMTAVATAARCVRRAQRTSRRAVHMQPGQCDTGRRPLLQAPVAPRARRASRGVQSRALGLAPAGCAPPATQATALRSQPSTPVPSGARGPGAPGRTPGNKRARRTLLAARGSYCPRVVHQHGIRPVGSAAATRLVCPPP